MCRHDKLNGRNYSLTSMHSKDAHSVHQLSQDDVIQIVFGVIATVLGALSVVLAWVMWRSRRTRIERDSLNEGIPLL